ncbi:MAG: hypothetical protein EGR91_07255 [Lachnospiraceae bacterium]|nr:hypothetical protein [Lachnospiraceae bacterium]
MQGIFRKENTDKALKYGIYRHLPTYEKIIRNLVSFLSKTNSVRFFQIGYLKKKCRQLALLSFPEKMKPLVKCGLFRSVI